jgi:hypothetical protein
MTPESWNNGARRNRLLLCNDSINTYPWQRIHATTEEILGSGVFYEVLLKLYNETTAEMVASWQRHKHKSRRISIVGNRD